MFSDGSMECLRSLSDTGLWDHGLPSHQWYLPCPTMLELELPFAWHFSLIPGFHPGRQGSALNIAINSPLVDSFYHATCSLCSLFCLFPHGIWRGKENTKAHPKIVTQGSKGEVSKHFLNCRKAKPYDDSGHFEYPIAMLSSMCS